MLSIFVSSPSSHLPRAEWICRKYEDRNRKGFMKIKCHMIRTLFVFCTMCLNGNPLPHHDLLFILSAINSSLVTASTNDPVMMMVMQRKS